MFFTEGNIIIYYFGSKKDNELKLYLLKKYQKIVKVSLAMSSIKISKMCDLNFLQPKILKKECQITH